MELQRQTVTDLLWATLAKLMDFECLAEFRLVGGTSLSLLLGHRVSVDIDLFTDSEYGTIDYLEILRILEAEFKYVEYADWRNKSMGNSCFIGDSSGESIKLDLFYTDTFIHPVISKENIRLSSLEEIAAMKLDVIGRGGRKKDFWDIHALFEHFDLKAMLDMYSVRYPYGFTNEELLQQLVNFEQAIFDPNPKCLMGKYWELIELDIEEKVKDFS